MLGGLEYRSIFAAVKRALGTLGVFVSVKDPRFMATGDGSSDDRAAIQAAIDYVSSLGGGTVFFPAGSYKVASGLTLTASGVHLLGAGRLGTKLKFAPTANGTLLKVANGASMVRSWSLRDITLYSDDATFTKTALEIIDAGEYDVTDVEIAGSVVVGITSFWSGANSIGIYIKGREWGKFSNVWSVADRPLLIGVNPNNSIDIDHHEFDVQAIANGNPCVEVLSNVDLSNVEFRGGAWVLGTHGFYWVDTATVANSAQLSFKNVRREQSTSAAGYNVRIEHNNALQTLSAESCDWDLTQNGFYLRNVRRVKMDECSYGGVAGKTAIDMTGIANSALILENTLLGDNATVTLTNMVRVMESIPTQTTYNFGEFAVYAFTGHEGVRLGAVTSPNIQAGSTANVNGRVLVEDMTGVANGVGLVNLGVYLNSRYYRLLGAPQNMVRFFDDFLGDVLMDQWNGRVGSDGACVAPAIVVTTSGFMRTTTGAGAGATMAVNGVQLDSALNWQAQNGDLVFEARVKLGDITNVALYVGFTDQTAALEMPFTLAAGDVLTSNASDGCGILFDTAADTDNWWLVGVKADADAAKQNTGLAPAAGTFETFRIELSAAGQATFYRNGVVIGVAMANAVSTAIGLTPVIAGFSRTNAIKNIDADYILIEARR